MLFSSTEFLFFFLPGVIFCYYVLCRKSRLMQNILLLISSLLFYAWGEPKFAAVMVLSILLNWFFGLMAERFRTKKGILRFWLVAATVFNLGLLFIFKYLMFTLNNVNAVFGLNINVPVINLPIGISFFTFQAFSYVLDISRGVCEAQKNPLYAGLYVSFFPQLIAGPIVRYETIARDIKHRKENLEDFSLGVSRFIVGFLKKVLLANNMAVIAKAAFDSTEPISTGMAWLGLIAYTFQIYYDFSGYSDMAIGMGKMFGFHFLENFDYPYISKSVSEFWRRWHISLGTWLRDYVYFPMGGSRVKTKSRLVFNLFVVWLLTGLWHGANWTYIVWGLMYFILITFEKLTGFEQKGKKLEPLKHIYTMAFVMAGWVIFRARDLSAAGEYFLALSGLAGSSFLDGEFFLHFKQNLIFLLACALFSAPIISFLKERFTPRSKTADVLVAAGFIFFLTVAVSYLIKGTYNPFIYFNF